MMGMQTMQAQQPMQQGGGKGSAIQPQQGGYPQQSRPMDMGMSRGGNLPPDFYASAGSPNFGSMPQQQGMGMDQISNNQQQLPQYQPQYQTGAMDQFVMNQRTDPFGGQTPNQDQLQNYNRFQSSQQARFGQPNRYSNTTQQQPWDNANINPQPSGKGMQSQQPMQGGGKGGKNGGMQQGGQMQNGGKGQAVGGYPTAATNFGQPTQTAPYPTAATNFGQPTRIGGLPTAPTSPIQTELIPQVDSYDASTAGGQGA
jgi:hypothetical protein